MQLQCGARALDLSQPVIMGVLNATPDSFSDGGSYYSAGRLDLELALSRAEQMVAEGAAIIDIGGESTRPGAKPVSEQEELDRVIPLVQAIATGTSAIVSVDTSTPAVIAEAAKAGAGLVNDVRALQREGALTAAAATGLPVCLMHMQGEPGSMQAAPHYANVVAEVGDFLAQRKAAAINAGIAAENILLDPGFGFGKTDAHNLSLLRGLAEIAPGGEPILAGLSRKSMIGRLLGRDVDQRLAGSLALAMLAAERGARILRVHDVAETRDVLSLLAMVQAGPGPVP
ncbi:dihydropteroate synthase [Biformimicrobium ophioploci]|uniref:Dihydropteroate synthase n=1 Tax=Biformimicrobium ophioploci TaxID=3036711 RepID=A0ABQ6LWB8_9GAMM|nr:dihydropteroate synthase [Microbulbifer sp. NKW57]GMG86387.1 dihydropteroate synthase [Microbulbifer sp. NKW57]